jgi:hypothetical protein
MIKIFFISLVFLIAEISFLESYLANAGKHSLWKIPFKLNSQRRAFKIVNNILTSTEKSVFVFGGSSSREFFASDKNITADIPYPFYNCATSNQTSYDSLKMQNLLAEGNIIIYGIHPKSLQDPAFGKQQIIDGVYFGGQYYKYPVKIYEKNLKNYLEDSNTSTIHKFFPVTNAYIYLLKEYIKNHSLKNLLKFKLNHTTPVQYNYLKEPMPYDKLEKKLTQWQKKSSQIGKEHLLLNFKLIEKMILLSKEHNTTFILWELPFSPIIDRYFNDKLTLYYQKIESLKKQYPDMIFISNKVFKPSKQNLFYDSIHLRPIGRKYYYEDTINTLKEVLK